jgi:hypothetical protein
MIPNTETIFFHRSTFWIQQNSNLFMRFNKFWLGKPEICRFECSVNILRFITEWTFVVFQIMQLFQIASIVLCKFFFHTSEITGLKYRHIMNKQMHFIKHVQSRNIILEQHVSAIPVTISGVSYN